MRFSRLRSRLTPKLVKPMITETRSELIDKIIKAYELETKDVADAVELYYDAQQLRIMHANRKRTEPLKEPEKLPKDYVPLTHWFNKWLLLGEAVLAGKLKGWVLSDRAPAEAKWAYDQIGIGPIIAAGLASHISIEKAQTPSAVWKFAGQAPGFDRKVKGQKLPYNARLKVLCWKLGESFVKVSGKDGATYGHLYSQFKAEEIRRNESGQYKEAAAQELRTKKITDKEAKAILESGHLTNGQLHSRAKRRAVKIFLVHYWQRGREAKGLPVRGPYVETVLGHDGIIPLAVESEPPRDDERARINESSSEFERAKPGESPQLDERAMPNESPMFEQRVTQSEPPNRAERANALESSKIGERANLSESSRSNERAKPKRKERKAA
jgi:hypothetical protein